MPAWLAPAIAAGASIYGAATSNARNEKQYHLQKRLYDVQDQHQRSMALFNQQQQMEMWKATGPVGEMEQLKKAGLNPGLIYGMGGTPGGTTQSAQAQGPSTTQAGRPESGAEYGALGLQLGQMLQMQKAQIDNLNANSDKARAEAQDLRGETTESASRIEDIKQGIENKKSVQRLTDVEADIAEIDKEFQGGTLEQRIANIANEATRIAANARSAITQANIDGATQENKIKLVKAELANKLADTILKDAETKLTDEQKLNLGDRLRQEFTLRSEELENKNTDRLHDTLMEIFRQKGVQNQEAQNLANNIIQALVLGGLLKGPGRETIKGFQNKY